MANIPSAVNTIGEHGSLPWLSPGLSFLSNALLFSPALLSYHPAESIITFISLQSSYNWYLKLSQFETVFLGYLMLQICFFRYLEILPINLNNFYLGEASGRKRRRRETLWNSKHFDCNDDAILPVLFKVLRKLDDGNCLARTLCELESMKFSKDLDETRIVKSTSGVLQALKLSAKFRNKIAMLEEANEDAIATNHCIALDGLQFYEDAVLTGSSVSYYHNSTICEHSYSACSLTKEDIVHYVTILIDADIL